jgi:hypothetical protein
VGNTASIPLSPEALMRALIKQSPHSGYSNVIRSNMAAALYDWDGLAKKPVDKQRSIENRQLGLMSG